MVFISIFIFLSIIVVVCLFLGRALPTFNANIVNNDNNYYSLRISKDIYYRQTLNNCAPYSVMAVINILQNKIVDPEKLASETTWRLTKNLTYPQGVLDLLAKYDIKTMEYILFSYNNNEKVNWIKNTISNDKPIIFMVGLKHVRHFFTIIGYDSEGFLLYDSYQDKSIKNPRKTKVDREEYPGNRYYSFEEFLKLWDKGGYFIFYNNWAVVCEI
jgi:hypothetical protein